MSVLPPPQKDGEIKFYFVRSLPYRKRMAAVFGLLAAGLALQVTIGFWPGFALMAAAQLLGMNSGYNSSPKETGKESWERVTPDEYTKIKQKAAELSRWDQDFFDGTNISGMIGFVVIGLLSVVSYAIVAQIFSFPDGYWIFFGLDAAVLLVPLWFIGTRDYLRKDKLVIKVEMLQKVMAALSDPSDVQVHPMLDLASTETGGKEPGDARLMVRMVGAPQEFYGVQVQLSINSVQGKDYPYLYCVLIAKKGSGLLDGWEDLVPHQDASLLAGVASALFGGVFAGQELVYEPSESGEVDIIVVRQHTSQNTGYYTSTSAAMKLVNSSLDLARALLKKNGPPPLPPQAR